MLPTFTASKTARTLIRPRKGGQNCPPYEPFRQTEMQGIGPQCPRDSPLGTGDALSLFPCHPRENWDLPQHAPPLPNGFPAGAEMTAAFQLL